MSKYVRKRSIKNVARRQVMSYNDVVLEANRQIFLREFNPAYDQVILRISKAPQSLRFGAPPGHAQ